MLDNSIISSQWLEILDTEPEIIERNVHVHSAYLLDFHRNRTPAAVVVHLQKIMAIDAYFRFLPTVCVFFFFWFFYCFITKRTMIFYLTIIVPI